MKTLQKAISVAIELALALFLVLVILAPFHAAETRHLTLTQSIDTTLAVASGDTRALERGERIALYRFNHGWKAPIGTGVVESVDAGAARIRVNPREMAWPLGHHGTIVHEGGRSFVTLGEDQGFFDGSTLNVFADRVHVGEVQITSAGADRSEITIPSGIDTSRPLTVSEFSYATQVSYFDNNMLSSLEIGAILLVLALYVLAYARAKCSPFLLLGEKLRALPISRAALFWIVHLVASVPFIWFVAKMPLYLGGYIASYISSHFFSHYLYPYLAIDAALPYVYAVVAALYFGYLIQKRRSPILALWQLISYKGRSAVGTVTLKRGLVLWALHLVIVYAFAWTLLGFLRGDIQAAMAIGFPAPTLEAAFEQAKFLIWALTVVGVLIGYGYSVLSILWGKYIRNLDFTVTGWLTNGFCYPFLGIVIWQMTPGFTGTDPIVTGGPLLYLMLVLGLTLNLLYMLSIFNLGILFDLMTDKGVRTSGFYSVIRHPNYMLEACMFLVTELVGLAAGIQWLGISMYFFLYWIRSEREDNFMQWSNPDYAEYQKKTPWKFIPGIY